jgi:ribose transport system ATP-binding protein
MTQHAAGLPVACWRQAGGIRVEDVRVHYGAIQAVAGVSLQFRPGVVSGLVGHNGSGKSTLARVLAGNESPTSGEVIWDGQPLTHGSGVAVVHQSLGLAADLSAIENYGISSKYDTGSGGWINWRREKERFESHRALLDVHVQPDTLVRDLTPSQRAGLALMRSLRVLDGEERESKFVILDEISSYLDPHERQQLNGAVASLAKSGVGVVFISHYLDEVLAMCSEVNVLRSGRLVGTFETAGMSKSQLSGLMFGDALPPSRRPGSRPPADGQQRFTLRPFLDVEVQQGEILGVTGRSGGDHELLPYLLVEQMRRHRQGPTVSLVPSDRGARGVWAQGSIAENLTISRVGQFRRWLPGGVSTRKERGFVKRWLAGTNFRVSGPETKLEAMSGGMQQKVLVGRALLDNPRLLVLHEPTQGIDVSVRADIEQQILQAARSGTAVLLVSPEHDELVALCDSVIVCGEDGTAVRLSGDQLSETTLAATV